MEESHINSLELLAVLLALQTFEDVVNGQSHLVWSDNMTVVAYINHKCGTDSMLLSQLHLFASYCSVAGLFNTIHQPLDLDTNQQHMEF